MQTALPPPSLALVAFEMYYSRYIYLISRETEPLRIPNADDVTLRFRVYMGLIDNVFGVHWGGEEGYSSSVRCARVCFKNIQKITIL